MGTRIPLAVLVFSTLLGAQVFVGFQLGPPPPPVYMVRPAAPGPGFLWVEGYWYPFGHHYQWHDGYWTRPPYPRAYWSPSHYDGSRFFAGYWAGPRGRVEHDHEWDREPGRDFDHGHGHGHEHD